MSDDRLPWPSIPALAEAAANSFGDRLAIIDGATRLTYAALLERSRDVAAALVESGIGRGDRVAIWLCNSVEWVVSLLGLSSAGAVLIPINTRFKGLEAGELLARSRARALVTMTDFLGVDCLSLLEEAGVALPDLRTVVVARGECSGRAEPWAGFLERATPAARAEAARRSAALRGDDESDILFTSGTTGAPKGVVMTHERTLRVGADWVAMAGLRAGDRYLMVNPYFHMFGLKAGILAALMAGATMYPQAVFDVGAVLELVAAEGITVLPGPPTIYQAILDYPGRNRYDLSTLRVAGTGGADIPVELIRRVHRELPFSCVITGYGLTEAGSATATRPEDDAETIATTAGRPRPGFEVRIADQGGRELPNGEAGEVLLRAASVMSHYLDDPEATAQVLSPEGWLRTGDLGILDEAGNLRIVGRIKDMFIVGGFNVYPAEVENLLLRHPGIRQAAVVGIPDHRLGEVGAAFVVGAPEAALTEAQVIEWSRDHMANFKVPRRVVIVDELPLNATGKVLKDVLRDRLAVTPGTPGG